MHNKIAKTKRSTKYIILVVLSFIAIQVGAYEIYKGIIDVRTQNELKGWPTVKGRVIATKINFSSNYRHRGIDTYDVTYHYSVGNKSYQSYQRLIFNLALSKRFREGNTVCVFYNPQNPESSVLMSDPFVFKHFMLAGVFIMISMVLLVISSLS